MGKYTQAHSHQTHKLITHTYTTMYDNASEALEVYKEGQKLANSANKGDITELKALKSPPSVVIGVVAGVSIALGQKNHGWNDSKKLLADPAFLDRLIKASKKNGIDAQTAAKLKPIVNDPAIRPEHVRKNSAAAAGLASWLHGVYAKYTVVEYMESLKDSQPDVYGEMQEFIKKHK